MWFWKTKADYMAEEITYLRAQVAQLQSYVLATSPIGLPEAPRVLPMEGIVVGGPDEAGMPEVTDAEQTSWLNLAMSEPEEDIEWARQAGDISDARANQLLEELIRERQDEI